MVFRFVLIGSLAAAVHVSAFFPPATVHGQGFLDKLDAAVRQKLDPNQPPAKPAVDEELPAPKGDAVPSGDSGLILGDAGTNAAAPPAASKAMRGSPDPAAVPAASNGYLGLIAEEVPGGEIGVLVVEVTRESPAWRAGFRDGDRVLAVAGHAIGGMDAFGEQLSKLGPGQAVKFLVDRQGRNVDLTAVLQDRELAQRVNGAPVVVGPIGGSLGGSSVNGNPAVGPLGMASRSPQETAFSSNLNLAPAGYLGITTGDLSPAWRQQFSIPAFRGAAVTTVVKGSPADNAGLKPGDAVIEADGLAIESGDQLTRWISASRPGQLVELTYFRGQQAKQARIVLGQDPAMESPERNVPSQNVLPRIPAVGPPVTTSNAELQAMAEQLQILRTEMSNTERRLDEIQRQIELILERLPATGDGAVEPTPAPFNPDA